MRTEPEPPRSAVVELALEGEIDLANAGALGDELCALIDSAPPAIAVVCSSVAFIESRGLAMMARVQRYADESGCPLSWRELPVHVLRTIHVNGLDEYLTIEA